MYVCASRCGRAVAAGRSTESLAGMSPESPSGQPKAAPPSRASEAWNQLGAFFVFVPWGAGVAYLALAFLSYLGAIPPKASQPVNTIIGVTVVLILGYGSLWHYF